LFARGVDQPLSSVLKIVGTGALGELSEVSGIGALGELLKAQKAFFVSKQSSKLSFNQPN
jgi:hypothetical protein